MDSKLKTDLDDTVLLRRGIEGILYITFAYNPQMANDIDGRCSQHVVVRIRERLRRGHYDGITSVNAQGIKVLGKS